MDDRSLILIILLVAVGGGATGGATGRATGRATGAAPWKFLHAYPRHLLARRAAAGRLLVDGKLDDAAWAAADWHRREYVDIRQHPTAPALDIVPPYQQADVAVLWDDDYLYVGARLRDPIVYATVPAGHNGARVPYVDNDFEVFLDPSGSTQFYKEFEMNVNNATYDVNWGVPDDFSLSCDGSGNHSAPYLPTCVNTSSHFYAGNWTMFSDNTSAASGGLKTATHTYSTFGSDQPNATGTWTVEAAFPIRAGATHGGLLDTDGSGVFDFSEYDPVKGAPLPGLPRYWNADISRVGHPRKYSLPRDEGFAWCPFFNCSEEVLRTATKATLDNPGAADCAMLAAEDKTILGSNPHYGCYWEWVLQDVGATNAYMHRPMQFAFLQFMHSDTNKSDLCGNIAFPARHLLLAVFQAQRNYKAQTGSFATKVSDLVQNVSQFCPEPACAGMDLAYAIAHPDIFAFPDIKVVKNATTLDAECSARPCFAAHVEMTVPQNNAGGGGGFVVKASITQNMRFEVDHVLGDGGVAPCLFERTVDAVVGAEDAAATAAVPVTTSSSSSLPAGPSESSGWDNVLY